MSTKIDITLNNIDNNKITIDFNNKNYTVKYYLTDNEFITFIATVIQCINDQKEKRLPFFIAKPLIIDKAICQFYINFSNDAEYDELVNNIDIFCAGNRIIDIIKEKIYYPQLEQALKAIDEGIEYQNKLDFYQNSMESKVEQIMDSILVFTNNFPKWADFVNKLLENGDGQKIIDLITPFIIKQLGMTDKDNK